MLAAGIAVHTPIINAVVALATNNCCAAYPLVCPYARPDPTDGFQVQTVAAAERINQISGCPI